LDQAGPDVAEHRPLGVADLDHVGVGLEDDEVGHRLVSASSATSRSTPSARKPRSEPTITSWNPASSHGLAAAAVGAQTPAGRPGARATSSTESTISATRSSPKGTPIDAARSPGPTKTKSSPSTCAIAAASCTAALLSIWAPTAVSAFARAKY